MRYLSLLILSLFFLAGCSVNNQISGDFGTVPDQDDPSEESPILKNSNIELQLSSGQFRGSSGVGHSIKFTTANDGYEMTSTNNSVKLSISKRGVQ